MLCVVLVMFGGVDSSVVVKLLFDVGYEVIGVFMCYGEEVFFVCLIDGIVNNLLLLFVFDICFDYK